MSRSSWDRTDQRSPIICTASNPPPRSWLHSLRKFVTELWKSSSGRLLRAVHPVVDLAQSDRIKDRPRGFPCPPPNRGHPRRRRVDGADPGQDLETVRILRADPTDDQGHRRARLCQVPHVSGQPGRVVADDDPVVRGVAARQLTAERVADAGVMADDDDGRPPVAAVAAGLILARRCRVLIAGKSIVCHAVPPVLVDPRSRPHNNPATPPSSGQRPAPWCASVRPCRVFSTVLP